MQFSFFHLMPWTELTEPPREWPASNRSFDPVKGKELYDTYLDTLAFAEECGFSWTSCNEHHFSPYGLMANCNLVASVLAQRTTNIKLGVVGNLVPLLNPVRVAEEYAMLDVMSGGRLVAGLLRGVPHEYIAYNIPPGESRARLKEAVELILKAWTEPEPFGWEGEFYRYPSVSIWPRPWQQPHPRIILSASNAESAEFAAEFARYRPMIGIVLISDLGATRQAIDLFREKSRERGYDPGPADIMTGHHTVIADTDAEAFELMRSAEAYFHGVLMRSMHDAQKLVIQKTRYFGDEKATKRVGDHLADIKRMSLEELVETGSILCGSPESVVKQIKRLRDELGHGVIQMTMKIGSLPESAVRRGMELFRDRILPELGGEA